MLSVHLCYLCWHPPTQLSQSCTVGTAKQILIGSQGLRLFPHFSFFFFLYNPTMELMVPIGYISKLLSLGCNLKL